MGREKLHKPRKTRAWEQSPLQKALAQFDRDSLWTLLQAAGRSPGVRHRWASVTHLIATASTVKARGAAPATASDLPGLLDQALEDLPQLRMLEDFMPEDPRGDVRFAVGDSVYRLFPGNVERPIADLERLFTVADAADDVLIERLGFGVRHVADVALAHMTDVVAAVESTWATPSEHDIGDTTVTFLESELMVEPADRGWTGPHAMAMAWLTTPAGALGYEPAAPTSAFGTAMRVICVGEEDPRWVPLNQIPEALGAAVLEMARLAGEADWRARWKFAQLTTARVRRRLWRFCKDVTGSPDREGFPDVSTENVATWAGFVGPRDVLAVQVIATLDGQGNGPGKPVVVAAAETVSAGQSYKLRFSAGAVTIRPGVRVIPILVYASAGHLVTFGPPGALRLSIEDLDWIAQSATDEMDLFHFAEEMTRSSLPESFGLETINVWDWWHSNGGALTRSGVPPHAMLFELHRGGVEWERAVQRGSLEIALATLRLDPLRDWDVVDQAPEAPATVMRWELVDRDLPPTHKHWRPRPEVVTLHVCERPVSLHVPTAGDKAAHVAFDLAVGYAFALRAVADAWIAAADEAEVRGMQIRFVEAGPTAPGVVFSPEIEARGEIVFAVMRTDFVQLAELVDGDATMGRQLMADAFAALLAQIGVTGPASAALHAAWLAAPPQLTMKSYNTLTVRNEMQRPVEIESPLAAELDRRVAAAVADAGVKPGRYSPDEAKALDRDTLAPAALQVLRDRLSRFSADDLIHTGMIQLERILAQRASDIRLLQQSAESLTLRWDPVDRQRTVENDSLRLRRSAELLVEAALLTRPVGRELIDERSWAEVLAASHTYFEATMRSETLHYQLATTSLEISELFELSTVETPISTAHPEIPTLDAERFAADVARERFGSAKTADGSTDDADSSDHFLNAANEAFFAAMGARVTDITTALSGLVAWPLDEGDPDAVIVDPSVLIEWLLEATVAGELNDGRERMEAAVGLLSSHTDDYAKEPWVPWLLRTRKTRLLIRPLPVLSDGRLVIAPHFCFSSWKVYMGYWEHGLLPWSQTGSAEVDLALDRARSVRNRALEDDVETALCSAGWTTVSRIKPNDGVRLGLATVSTEIDLVAGRSGSDTIWVIEVKDPAPVFTPRDIRRHLDRFYGGDRSYAALLARKANEVAQDPAAVAEALGLPGDVSYRVEALFVTRRVMPAAYTESLLRFTTLSSVLDVITPSGGSQGESPARQRNPG